MGKGKLFLALLTCSFAISANSFARDDKENEIDTINEEEERAAEEEENAVIKVIKTAGKKAIVVFKGENPVKGRSYEVTSGGEENIILNQIKLPNPMFQDFRVSYVLANPQVGAS